MEIGFIGQGWIGKHYADDFENRKFPIVRYALEYPFNLNKSEISKCDMVFIAVPTPTTKTGFDVSTVRQALKLIRKGSIAIIKSTILPGTTNTLQKENPDIFVLHSPEFLVESTAAYDASHPNRNIIGIPIENDLYRRKAQMVLDVLPDAPYSRILAATDAELIKYAGNCFLLTKVMYINLVFDLVEAMRGDWKSVRDALIHDPRVGTSHTDPTHKGGRGAGGDCFIKDFEAFRTIYKEKVGDSYGDAIFTALKDKNIQLLRQSHKDLDLLDAVYGSR